MARCPACHSVAVVPVISPEPRSFCADCGHRWVYQGAPGAGAVGPSAGPGTPTPPPRPAA